MRQIAEELASIADMVESWDLDPIDISSLYSHPPTIPPLYSTQWLEKYPADEIDNLIDMCDDILEETRAKLDAFKDTL